jgi:predicted transcriptional regulator
MSQLTLKRIEAYRQVSYRTKPGNRVKTKEQAIQFVNERGFVHFWPIKGSLLPSLWVAVAGDRPVANAHDDPGHATWGWKDSLLGAKRWYYAKVVRKKSTMISLSVAPFFYALSENYGSPEEDYLIQYMQGEMTQAAKAVYEALLSEGALDTITLRKAANLSSRESDSRFNRALVDLQADFKVIPIGTSQSGGWRYSFVYELVHRHHPELVERARLIQEDEARYKLVQLYFKSVGAATRREVIKIFRWSPAQVDQILEKLAVAGVITRNLQIKDHPDEWMALPDLL